MKKAFPIALIILGVVFLGAGAYTVKAEFSDVQGLARGQRWGADDRAALVRTGIGWNRLPTALFGASGATCWRRLAEWQEAGVWEDLLRVLLDRHQRLDAVDLLLTQQSGGLEARSMLFREPLQRFDDVALGDAGDVAGVERRVLVAAGATERVRDVDAGRSCVHHHSMCLPRHLRFALGKSDLK